MEARRYEPRYTVADYEQWPGDWELWHGTAVSMAPSPTFDHQEILTALASSLREQLKTNATCHCRIVVGHDWRIANDTVVRPDLMIVCDPFAGEFLDRAPTLVAEVLSPATEDKDRHAKRELYVAQGVKHYLIVRPGDHAVEWINGSKQSHSPIDLQVRSIELHPGCEVSIPRKVEV